MLSFQTETYKRLSVLPLSAYNILMELLYTRLIITGKERAALIGGATPNQADMLNQVFSRTERLVIKSSQKKQKELESVYVAQFGESMVAFFPTSQDVLDVMIQKGFKKAKLLKLHELPELNPALAPKQKAQLAKEAKERARKEALAFAEKCRAEREAKEANQPPSPEVEAYKKAKAMTDALPDEQRGERVESGYLENRNVYADLFPHWSTKN